MQNSSDHTSARPHSRQEEEKRSRPQVTRTQETETQEMLRIQLEQHIAELEQEKQLLTERTRQAEHLLVLAQNAQKAAEHALDSRKNFLANVIHDLKSPLTSIIGSTQLLQHRIEKYQPPEREKYLQTIEIITASTRRMADMIGDLLDLARLQMGLKLELNHAEGDLLNLIRHVVNEYQQATAKHQLTIQANCDCLPMIYDAPHIERMLANLLSNAIKYSPQGGEITITIAQQSSPEGKPCAIIHLQDHGIGIPAQDLPHIFEPFHRACNSEHNFPGTGLGLASANQIIAQHGGTITVTSEENQGTIFTILLPLHAA